MDEVAEIKHRLDIVEIISSYLTLKKAGANLKGLCPFHSEKSPSFMVSPERQTFKCFGCGEGGDIFTFIEKIEGLDFFNTLKLLADRAGVKLERESVQYGNKEHKADQKTKLFEINDWARKVYHKILLDHPKASGARKYLEGRGLSDLTIQDFEIGYAPDSWDFLIRFLKSKGYTEVEMEKAGVVIRNDRGGFYDRFRGRVMFPISNIMGAVVGFTSRTLKDDAKEAKYINSSDSPIYTKGEVFYGLDKAKAAIREKSLAIVVEGQMDVIACHQAGFKNVVASSGTALTEHQLRILNRYAAELAFCFDTDNAGQTAMKRAVTLALKNDVNVKIISMPAPFKDPDEAIKSSSKNWIRALEAAKPSLEYWIDLLVKENPDLSVLAKKKIAKEILPVIKLTFSPIEKEAYIKYLARKLSVSEQSLLDSLDKTKGEEKKSTEAPAEPRELSIQERILGLLWLEPKLLQDVYEITEKPDFRIDGVDTFWAMIQQKNVERERVPSQEKNILDQLTLSVGETVDTGNEEAVKAEIIFLLKRWQGEKKEDLKNNFAEKIREAESQGDRERIKELLKEYSSLIK